MDFNLGDLIPKYEAVKVRKVGAATDELHETIKSQIEAMNRQSMEIRRLTYVALLLAVIQTAVALEPFGKSMLIFIQGLLRFIGFK